MDYIRGYVREYGFVFGTRNYFSQQCVLYNTMDDFRFNINFLFGGANSDQISKTAMI